MAREKLTIEFVVALIFWDSSTETILDDGFFVYFILFIYLFDLNFLKVY